MQMLGLQGVVLGETKQLRMNTIVRILMVIHLRAPSRDSDLAFHLRIVTMTLI